MLIRRATVLFASAGVSVVVAGGWGAGIASAAPADSGPSSTASTDKAAAQQPATPGTPDTKPDPPKTDPGASDDETSDKGGSDAQSVSTSSPSTAPKTDSNEASKAADVLADVNTKSDPKPEVKPDTDTVHVASVQTAAEQGTKDSPDAPPADNPADWTLLAAARRDLAAPADDSEKIAPKSIATVAPVDPLPANWEDQYSGHPTLFTQLVITGLRAVDVVLKPFGGLLKFTSLKVPLFTDGVPPFFFRNGLDVQQGEFDGMTVWTLTPKDPTSEYVVALHGGAYVAEVSLFHWWTYTDMARDTGATVVVPLYKLVPDGGTAAEAVPATADLIEKLITDHGAQNVSVLGDSAGGGLALAAVQTLVKRGSTVPSRMVLFAPWLDATVSDPLSAQLDSVDPLLDVPNLQQAGHDWAGDLDVRDPLVSPLFGSLAGLPPTAVYSGSLDLLTPDTLRLQQRVTEGGFTNFTFNLRRHLIHDWGIFGFLPEAHTVRPQLYRDLLGDPAPHA
jgi:acetyl esterase/lipase